MVAAGTSPAPSGPCPDPGRWRARLDGLLPEDDRIALDVHLESCEGCQRTLEGLAADGAFWSGAARHLGGDQDGDDEALRRTVAALEAGPETDRAAGPAEAAPGEEVSLGFLRPPEQPGSLGRLAHYEVREVIGRGGMGLVLKAFDAKLHRVVALKVMAPQSASCETARRRFVREARAAAAVRDDHVVTIHAVDEVDGLPYLVMEYVSGVSLQERLDRGGPLELGQVLRIGMQASAGLAAAHAQGLVHRDVKPTNILLENGVERVKLTDFGLARAVDDASLTRSGVVAGTPEYMAPEQARGEAVDHRADLFSLGSVLYAMCTGRPPFRADSVMAVLRRVSDEAPPPIGQTYPEVPGWLVAIIAKLHARDPTARFRSAAEVAELLGRHLAHLQQPDAVPVPVKPARRRLPWLVVAAGLLAAAGAVLAWPQVGRRGERPDAEGTRPPETIRERPKAEVAPPPAPSPPPTPSRPPHVLLVLASDSFNSIDYATIRNGLRRYDVRVSVASTTRGPARPLAGRPGEPVTPDLTLAEAKASAYDAVVFCGGPGVMEFVGDGPAARDARNLIAAMVAGGRLVTASTTGPVVLADAGILKGLRATCFKYGPFAVSRRDYVAMLRDAGVLYVDEPVVVSGRFITTGDPKHVREFVRALLRGLGVEPRPEPEKAAGKQSSPGPSPTSSPDPG